MRGFADADARACSGGAARRFPSPGNCPLGYCRVKPGNNRMRGLRRTLSYDDWVVLRRLAAQEGGDVDAHFVARGLADVGPDWFLPMLRRLVAIRRGDGGG